MTKKIVKHFALSCLLLFIVVSMLVMASSSHAGDSSTPKNLYTFGSNARGKTAQGTASGNTPTPTKVNDDIDWASASAGSDYSLLLKNDGTLWSSGSNDNGRGGRGSAGDATVPEQVGSDNDWAQIAAGTSHSLAIKTDGSLWSWGSDDNGRAGHGGIGPILVPTQVGEDTDWISIATNGASSLALKSDGTIWSWGNNIRGITGQGTDLGSTLTPTQIGEDNDWVFIATGNASSFAIKQDGSLYAWGWALNGQTGLGISGANTLNPTRVGVDNDWVQVSGAPSHTLGIKSDGTLWSWGSDLGGRGGRNYDSDATVPVQVGTDNDWTDIAAGDGYSLALKADKTMWSAGNFSQGANGLGTSESVFTQVGTENFWSDISAAHVTSSQHSIALSSIELTINIASPSSDAATNTWAPNIDWSVGTTCDYSWDNEVFNEIDCAENGSDIPEPSQGNNTLYLRSSAMFGEVLQNVSNQVSFTYDTIDPELEILSPLDSAVTNEWSPSVQWDDSNVCESSYNSSSWTVLSCANDGADIPAPSDGDVTLYIRGTDEAGNETTESVSFTYDTIAPSVNAGQNRHVNSNFIQSDATANDATSGINSYVWSQVSGPSSVEISNADELNPEMQADVDGIYVLRLSVTDNAGNTAHDDFTLIWDTTAAEITLDSFPDQVNNETSATFEFSATDELSDAWDFDCRLNSAGFSGCNSGSVTYNDLDEGEHTFIVQVTDGAGNVSEEQYSWIIDLTGPVVSIDSAPSTLTTNSAATFEFSATDNFSETLVFECSFNAGAFVPCSDDIRYEDLIDGTYSFVVRVTDEAGNFTEEEFSWTIDSSAPVITLIGSEIITIRVGENYVDEGATAFDATEGDLTSAIITTNEVDVTTPGIYTVTYDVTDEAGNAAETVTRTVRVLDNDGIDDEIEDAAPGDGDGNNDGIPDSLQAHVTSFVNQITGEYVVVENLELCSSENVSVIDGTAADHDSKYSYPQGLINFELDCGQDNAGLTVGIKLYFYNVDTQDLAPRKYDPLTNSFMDIDEVEIDRTELHDLGVTVVSYEITDGGVLDIDGEVNGTIVDPFGLGLERPAVPSEPSDQDSSTLAGALPATGTGFLAQVSTALSAIAFGLGLNRKKLFFSRPKKIDG